MTYPEPREEGGKAPRKIPPKEFVVEPAPSLDGAPCYAAYTVDCERTARPQFALRIYDTTPGANNPDRIRQLADKIHRGTERERYEYTPDIRERDRIEVVGLPFPQDASEEHRVQACMAHHMAEVSARRKQLPEFYLPATFDRLGWWREVLVLERLDEGWEGAALYRPEPENGFTSEHGMVPPGEVKTYPLGRFLSVRWDLTELAGGEN